jgi:hypothetical protein
MKRRLVLALVALTLGLGGVGAAQATQPQASPVAVAKTCGRGYVHAVIDRKEKCLRAGEFCAARYEGQYHRYGFTCRAGHLRRR